MRHEAFGLLAYGGVLSAEGNGAVVNVQTTGPVSRRVFVGPLGVTLTVDAGSVRSFSYEEASGSVSLTLTQLPGAPKAAAAVLWIETNDAAVKYRVSTPSGVTSERLGWRVPLPANGDVVVELRS